MRHCGIEETAPISPRHSGTEGNKEVPDVNRTAHLKTIIPVPCEGDFTRAQI